jgi:hypothetical protein
MALALRSSTSTARALQNLAQRTDLLEARLETLPPLSKNDLNHGRLDESRGD